MPRSRRDWTDGLRATKVLRVRCSQTTLKKAFHSGVGVAVPHETAVQQGLFIRVYKRGEKWETESSRGSGDIQQPVREGTGKLQNSTESSTKQAIDRLVFSKRPAGHLGRIPYLRVETVDNGFELEFLVPEFGEKDLQLTLNKVFAGL